MITDDKLAKPDPSGNAGKLEKKRKLSESVAIRPGQTGPLNLPRDRKSEGLEHLLGLATVEQGLRV